MEKEETYNPYWCRQKRDFDVGQPAIGSADNDIRIILHADAYAHDAEVH